MSYSVHLYPRAFEKKFKAANDPAFLEDPKNLIPLGPALTQTLVEQLELRGFAETEPTKSGRLFEHEEWGADGLLTESGLYLSSSGDGIFEILMFGDEVADETIAKFDPQDGSWA